MKTQHIVVMSLPVADSLVCIPQRNQAHTTSVQPHMRGVEHERGTERAEFGLSVERYGAQIARSGFERMSEWRKHVLSKEQDFLTAHLRSHALLTTKFKSSAHQ